jgi:hypothetical protein
MTISNIRGVEILCRRLNLDAYKSADGCNCDAEETKVFIDGKEIQPSGTIILKKDDTILFEATGLQPNSDIYIKVKKAGIRWAEDTYHVNETGKVREILDVPEKDLTVNCTVTYYNADGDFVTTEFKLKID